MAGASQLLGEIEEAKCNGLTHGGKKLPTELISARVSQLYTSTFRGIKLEQGSSLSTTVVVGLSREGPLTFLKLLSKCIHVSGIKYCVGFRVGKL